MNVRLLTCMLLVSRLALAAPQLEWDAPQCAPPPPAGAQEVQAEVVIRERAPGDWLVTVIFVRPVVGIRRMTANSCEQAGRVAVVLLRFKGEEPPAEPLSPPPSPPPLPIPAPLPLLPKVAPAEVSLEPIPWRFSAGLGVTLDLGTVAIAEPRLAAMLSVERGWLRLALDGRFLGAGVAASLRVERAFELQAAGCAQLSSSRLSAGPCVAIAGGSWRATTALGTRVTAPIGAVGLQLRGAIRLVLELELSIVAGLRLNVLRPQPYNQDGVIFTTPLWAGDLQTTLGWRW